MRKTSLILVVAVACSFAAFAAEDADTGNLFVKKVVVNVHGGPKGADSSQYAKSHISVEPNRFATRSQLSHDHDELVNSGLFSSVDIRSEKNGDGFNVIYDIAVAPRLRLPLKITGNDAMRASRIESTMGVEEGDHIDRARLDVMVGKLRDEYVRRYYSDVVIDSSISQQDADGFATVSLDIKEGARKRLVDFEFSGNKSVDSSELKAALGRPSSWNPFKAFYSTWRHMAMDFETVRDKVIEVYRDRGFLNVAVAQPVVEIDEDGAAVMHVAITEGRVYTVSATSVSGVSLFPENEIAGIVRAIMPKTPCPASGSAISAAAKAMTDFYGARGYVDTTVEPVMDFKRGGDSVSIDFKVDEGSLVRIRSVQVRGNTTTKEKVVRRELTVLPGSIYNSPAAEISRRRVQNLGFFDSVRFYDIPVRGNDDLRDVVYEVTESDSTGRLMVGVGASSADDIMGFFEIAQNNFDIANWPTFKGAGQKASLNIQVGHSSREGDLAWSCPWFMDRKQTLDADLYRRELDREGFDEIRMGGGVGLTLPLHIGRLSLRAGAELVENDDLLDNDFDVFGFPDRTFNFANDVDDSYLRVPLRLSWLYDSRDQPFVPTSGAKNLLFAEAQSSSLGADYDNYKLGVDLRQYFRIFPGTLSLRLRAETIDSFGDSDDVPINDRLFLGGGRTVRGFRLREVGPKAIPAEGDGNRARPIGGRTLAMFSAEYAIPIAQVLRPAVFFDAGNVWDDAFDVDFSEYASSWGVGIRLDIPGFPIRLDYAFPLESDDDYTRKEHFIFWIGYE